MKVKEAFMSTIKVKYFLIQSEILGGIKEEEYKIGEETTLADLLLKYIPKRHKNSAEKWKRHIFGSEYREGETPTLKEDYMILVNGRPYNLLPGNGFKYKLKDGDFILIFPLIEVGG